MNRPINLRQTHPPADRQPDQQSSALAGEAPTPARRGVLRVKCPTCGQQLPWSERNAYRPFCSSRCQDSDFIAWAEQRQFIPGDVDYDDPLPGDD